MEGSELQFDANIVQNQSETYSSLTDLNGVPVFTSDFESRVAKVNQASAQSEMKLHAFLFSNQVPEEKAEDAVLQVMFLENNQQIINTEVASTQSKDDTWAYPAVGIIFVLFLFGIVWYCRKRERQIREKVSQESDFQGAEWGG